VDRNARRFGATALLLTFAAIAPGVAVAYPSAATSTTVESVMTDYPSRATFGVVAHYVVYRTQTPGEPATLAVLQAQTSLAFLATLHAQPMPNAIVAYPDGSVQRADGSGAFDAAASEYAQRHPQQPGQSDVAVRVVGTDAGTPLSVTTHVFAPAPAREAMIASGTIASLPTDALATPNYAFSCSPADYAHGTMDVKADTAWKTPTFVADSALSYYAVAGFCGVEQSFLNVTTERHWSSEYAVRTSGGIPGCINSVGKPKIERLGASAFTCYVRDWYAYLNFSSSIPWASHPLVALWFEGWKFNVLRAHATDVHMALLRVR
jgi:hypothetical protein